MKNSYSTEKLIITFLKDNVKIRQKILKKLVENSNVIISYLEKYYNSEKMSTFKTYEEFLEHINNLTNPIGDLGSAKVLFINKIYTTYYK